MRDTDWRPSPCPKCGKMRAAAERPVCDCEGDRTVSRSRFTRAMDALLVAERADFTERLDALLALKADEAFAGSQDPRVAEDHRAVFHQAREDFIREFGGPK